jgi:sugar lactone lactonase YvrE
MKSIFLMVALFAVASQCRSDERCFFVDGVHNVLNTNSGGGDVLVHSGTKVGCAQRLTQGPDGLYYISGSGCRIFAFAPSFDRGYLISGPDRGTGPNIEHVTDMTFDKDGDLIVLDAPEISLFRVDATTGDREIFSTGESSGTGNRFSASARAVATGSDGFIYIADDRFFTLNGKIFKVDLVSGNCTIFSDNSHGTGLNMIAPWGLAFGMNGDLFVADWSQNLILRIDKNTGNRVVFSSNSVGTGPGFDKPQQMVADAQGNLYVINGSSESAFIVEVDKNNGNRTVIASNSVGSGAYIYSLDDILVVYGGTIVVSDRRACALLSIDPIMLSRAILFPLMRIGSGPPLMGPKLIAREPSGDFVVCQSDSYAVRRVQKLWGARSTVSDETHGIGLLLGRPLGIGVRSNGDIIVGQDLDVAPYGSQVLRIDPATGDRAIISDSSHGTGPSLDQYMVCLCVGQDNAVYAGLQAVAICGSILDIDPGTGNRTEISGPSRGAGPAFYLPVGIAADASAKIFLVDYEAKAVFQIDKATGDRTIISGPSTGSGPVFEALQDIAVAASGRIYVTDSGLHAVSVFRVDPSTGARSIVASGCCTVDSVFDSAYGIVVLEEFAAAKTWAIYE